MDNIICNFHTLNMLQNLWVILDITFGFQGLFVCCSNGYLICLTLLFVWASTDFSYFYISISTSILASLSPDILENLSQIRLSLFVSLGAEQIISLAGINATEKTVGGSLPFVEFVQRKPPWMKCKRSLSPLTFEGCLCHSGSSNALFPNGRFLLDARRGNPSLPVCCESFQHQHQDAHVSRHFMGHFYFSVEFIIYC